MEFKEQVLKMNILYDVMKDENLSVEAKSIYCYLLSKTSYTSWGLFSELRVNEPITVKQACTELNISKDRWYKHIKQLCEYGYLTIEQPRNENARFTSNEYIIRTKLGGEFKWSQN